MTKKKSLTDQLKEDQLLLEFRLESSEPMKPFRISQAKANALMDKLYAQLEKTTNEQDRDVIAGKITNLMFCARF